MTASALQTPIAPALNLSPPDSDYTIFVWRQQQLAVPPTPSDGSSSGSAAAPPAQPTLHLHNPAAALPAPPAYRNPSYYIFHPARAVRHPHAASPSPSTRSKKSQKTKASRRTAADADAAADSRMPAFRKEFEKFHSENGVRTVMGSIGPVQNGTSPPRPVHP